MSIFHSSLFYRGILFTIILFSCRASSRKSFGTAVPLGARSDNTSGLTSMALSSMYKTVLMMSNENVSIGLIFYLFSFFFFD